MKSITIFCTLLFLMVFNFTHAQNSPSDSIKYNEILKKIDALDTKFEKEIKANDKCKLKLKLEQKKEEVKKFENELNQSNAKLKETTSICSKNDSLKNITINQLKTDLAKQSSTVTNLQQEIKTLENYKSNINSQIETIRKNLKNSLETSKKIDATYNNSVKILLADDLNSKEIITQLAEFMDNQKKINEIDSLMQIQNFSSAGVPGFKEVKTKINLITINPNFKGQVSRFQNVKNNFETLISLIEKYRKLQSDFKNEDDAKFAYRFQAKVRIDRNDPDIKELFLNYPCLNFYTDKLMDMDNRKTYTLPSTN
jgi:chromosome segregation ATPase